MEQTPEEKEWHDHVVEQLDRQAERAAYLAKYVFKLIPISAVVGLIIAGVVVHFWGWKEFLRMLFQVILTLTLGATVFAAIFRKLDKALKE